MSFPHKDLLGINQLSKEDILTILDATESFRQISQRPIKKVPTLRGRTIINLFFEPSTRTRTSFEIAGKRLSADVINISGSTSSVTKGETILDTGYNLQAMNPDIIVVRHSTPGVPHILARNLECSIINAGDGAHEHPTQALLDMATIREHKKTLQGLKVAIVGDISHSRVARSNILAMNKLGMQVTVVGPPTLIPLEMESLGVEVSHDLVSAIRDVDVIMMLRIQAERHNQTSFPSLREYSNLFGLNAEKLKKAREDVIILHPGPVNRGVEISPDVIDGNHSLILNQVNNGVAIRMTLMYLLLGGSDENTD
ncbi:MAG: aspartate carbamoyltransferase catalytic subunit [Nitrospina sp.]|nr:aspartate carbamoyltransferase catalytic subunit [Nitrospina sp.]